MSFAVLKKAGSSMSREARPAPASARKEQSSRGRSAAAPFADSASQEREADRASHQVMTGRKASSLSPASAPALARFSDTSHHVIEEAALPGAAFTPGQMPSIERGNVQRDYSQIGAASLR